MKAVIAPRIRCAHASDLAAIRRLLERAYLPTEDLTSAPGPRFWVLEAGAELVGVIGLDRAGPGGLLRSLAVAPAYRGQGIGRALIAQLEHEAQALGIAQLVLLTETAQAFFDRLGYTVIDRRKVPEELKQSAEFRSLCPASAVCMTKSVAP